MHDATEGGVLGGLYELARVERADLWVDKELIHVSEESSAVCAAFGLDPLATLSEGTLLITCGRTARTVYSGRCPRTGSRLRGRARRQERRRREAPPQVLRDEAPGIRPAEVRPLLGGLRQRA